MKIMIMGNEWEIVERLLEDEPRLYQVMGLCEYYEKKIILRTFYEHQELKAITIRHEIIHAYLHESGIAHEGWAENEQAIDWIAFKMQDMVVTAQLAAYGLEKSVTAEDMPVRANDCDCKNEEVNEEDFGSTCKKAAEALKWMAKDVIMEKKQPKGVEEDLCPNDG